MKFGAHSTGERLVYLYYDAIGDEAAAHREELRRFQERIAGDSARFVPLTVQEFVTRAVALARGDHRAYVDYLAERYL